MSQSNTSPTGGSKIQAMIITTIELYQGVASLAQTYTKPSI